MKTEKEAQKEIESLQTLRNLTQLYGEVASVRMRKSRDSVLYSRVFLADVNSVFGDVRASYARQVRALLKKKGLKRGGKITFLAHNGKTVSVFLSANTGLYGGLMRRIFDEFIKEVRTSDVEATIIGRQGRSLFLQEEPGRPYTYFDLPDRRVETGKLAEIIAHLVQYEEIHVHYGKFANILNQMPTEFRVSAVIPTEEERKEKGELYIFEPNLEKILMFFETEMFASLLEQTVRESQLAKFASRIVAMDKAGENIKESLERARLERLKLAHRTLNKKQISQYSSLSLWKK